MCNKNNFLTLFLAHFYTCKLIFIWVNSHGVQKKYLVPWSKLSQVPSLSELSTSLKCLQTKMIKCIFSIGNHMVLSSIWNEFTWVSFSKSWNCMSCFKCKLIPNWTRKTVWARAGRSFLKSFFTIEKTFKVSAQNFCYHFTWYRWLRKILIVSRPIIFQYYDV